ncbi:MAG: TIGR02678 family protein [Thioalkalivibrio sp.]|nr:TIGR02678 family protein [Thioalkalivibrio sp.]
MTAVPQPLPDVLERARAEERQRALRALLMRPLMDARHPAFVLVRRHQGPLREWLAAETGWHLQVESGFARLYKRPADHRDATRGAALGSGAQTTAFSRRRYALLCLILADLERGDQQITLARLGAGLIQAAADPALEAAGLRFRLDHQDERRDLVATVRLLLEYGVLARVAGDEEAFVRDHAGSDALYDINRRMLAALLVSVRGPSLVEMEGPSAGFEARLQALTEAFVPDTQEGRNRALRQALTARLLDDPVVYWDELPDDARQYLTSQRAAITRRIAEATDLVPEARAEGIAMVDPGQGLSDQSLPSEGTEGHVTLLIAAHLTGAPEGTRFTLDTLAEQVARWRPQYRGYWRRSALTTGSERALARQAVEQLRRLRLVAIAADDRILPLPALARFAVEAARTPQGGTLEEATGAT